MVSWSLWSSSVDDSILKTRENGYREESCRAGSLLLAEAEPCRSPSNGHRALTADCLLIACRVAGISTPHCIFSPLDALVLAQCSRALRTMFSGDPLWERLCLDYLPRGTKVLPSLEKSSTYLQCFKACVEVLREEQLHSLELQMESTQAAPHGASAALKALTQTKVWSMGYAAMTARSSHPLATVVGTATIAAVGLSATAGVSIAENIDTYASRRFCILKTKPLLKHHPSSSFVVHNCLPRGIIVSVVSPEPDATCRLQMEGFSSEEVCLQSSRCATITVSLGGLADQVISACKIRRGSRVYVSEKDDDVRALVLGRCVRGHLLLQMKCTSGLQWQCSSCSHAETASSPDGQGDDARPQRYCCRKCDFHLCESCFNMKTECRPTTTVCKDVVQGFL